MFEQISPVLCIIVVNFLVAPLYIIAQETATEDFYATEDESNFTYETEAETLEPTTTVVTTTRTPRPTEPRPDFTIPPEDSGKKFRDNFALFNCELLHRCNRIPRNKSCGRDWYLGTIAWFTNVCLLWKTNCLRLGLFTVQNSAMCEDFHLTHPNKTLWTFSNAMIDPPLYAPMGFNPYYPTQRPQKNGG